MTIESQLPYKLETLLKAAISHETLPEEFVPALEKATKGKYYGHTVLDLGVVSIFLGDPKSCTTRCSRTLKAHKIWNDTTVLGALLDLDSENNPLTLDLFPKTFNRR